MPDPALSLPDLLGESLVDDALFAAAYAESSDRERALMKTCIARLYDWYGPRKDTAREVATRWRGGFGSVSRSAPVDFALVLFDENFVSPARLLAALVPAAACGVPCVLAVRMNAVGDWARPLLTAMELAGQELVADLTGEDLSSLLDDLAQAKASGAVADLTGRPGLCAGRSGLAVHTPAFDRTAALYLDDPNTFDLEALAFIHPDTAFTVFGADIPLPGGFVRGGKDFPAFLDAVRDVAFVPADRIGDALDRARLVFGPGQEGCWVWPELHPGFFLHHRTAWTIGD
ncbi:hypothetical protein BerOc1_03516 [Pseudodesulfovibrio hydrargyri]|uniref:Uncharacterized protein n=1 Tax=Pseudodesulfovibrio hydrargyri TaxID=2125990 RepID=A0A1J5MZC6_9BACT|nr:hypothetical protein [Pseudodesulfovibrio hydrargyri]OIQ48763.1 hypothetical protein BerOc1_03516 [Pseudodesulfovibrio hydrargyri]